MSDFMDWLTGGTGDSTSAQTATGIPQSAPLPGYGFAGVTRAGRAINRFFTTPDAAPPLPLDSNAAASAPQPPPAPAVPAFGGPRALPALPAQPAPDAGNLPIGPGGLPNIGAMLENIKSAPPTPAQSAPVDAPPAPPAPPVPPQGDNLPPLPPSQEVAANAPPVTAAPTPLTPAPDAAPAAPSDTPAGRSLLDRIMGSDDPSTRDVRGLTEADRHATGFSALAKLGFGIMAASMPQAPGQRAAAIQQLGSIPAGVLKEQAAQIGMQAQAQRVQLGQQQLDAKKAGIEYMKSPEFQATLKSLPPQMQGVLKAAAAAGDIASIAKIQQGMMPKLSGNTIFNPSTGQATNTITGVTSGGGAPAPGGAAPAAGGAPAQPGAISDDPDAKIMAAIQAQGVPPQFQQEVADLVAGNAKLPGVTDRNGIGLQLTSWARNAAKAAGTSLDQTTYDLRQAARKSYAPQGVVGSQISSMNTLLQHTDQLRDAADNLGNVSFQPANWLKNSVASTFGKDPKDSFNQIRGLATKELDTLVSKNHATIAETASIRENLHDAQSPQQMQKAIDNIAHLAQARLQSTTQQGQRALGKKGMQDLDEQLDNPAGLKALQSIEANPIKGSDRHTQFAAIRQQFGLPADADVAHYEYRKLPDGTVQRKKK